MILSFCTVNSTQLCHLKSQHNEKQKSCWNTLQSIKTPLKWMHPHEVGKESWICMQRETNTLVHGQFLSVTKGKYLNCLHDRTKEMTNETIQSATKKAMITSSSQLRLPFPRIIAAENY